MTTRHTPLHAIIAGLFLTLCDTSVEAQPISQDELLPPLGATWHMRALQVVPALPPDERPMVWPYSTLQGNDVFGATYTMLAPASVPQGASYPEADRILRKTPDNGGGPIHTFIDVREEKSFELATMTPFITSEYTTGALLASYPMAYLQPVTGTHCFTSVSSSALTPYCGSTELNYIQHGRLELSFGNFPNARLVRTRRSDVNQQSSMDSSMTETLTWFTPGNPYPLLQFITVNYPNGTQARTGYILDETSVVGSPELTMHQVLHVFPVPCTGQVNIHAPNGGELDIVTADGRIMHSMRMAPSPTPTQIELATLPQGAYRAILRERTGIRSSALILAH